MASNPAAQASKRSTRHLNSQGIGRLHRQPHEGALRGRVRRSGRPALLAPAIPDSLIMETQLVARPSLIEGRCANAFTSSLICLAARWELRVPRNAFGPKFCREQRKVEGWHLPKEHPDSEVSRRLMVLIAVRPLLTISQNDSGSRAPGAANPIAVMTATRGRLVKCILPPPTVYRRR